MQQLEHPVDFDGPGTTIRVYPDRLSLQGSLIRVDVTMRYVAADHVPLHFVVLSCFQLLVSW